MDIVRLTGGEARAHLADLARLRIGVFAQWPYFYDGDDASEREYLEAFASADHAVIIAAFDRDTMVGAATASPLAAQEPGVRAPFEHDGEDLGEICYFGESVLLPEYRGRGLGHAFFDGREAHARDIGANTAAFCAVERERDDPRRPANARDLGPFWRKRGYAPVTGRYCHMAWKELGAADETPQRLQVWRKPL